MAKRTLSAKAVLEAEPFVDPCCRRYRYEGHQRGRSAEQILIMTRNPSLTKRSLKYLWYCWGRSDILQHRTACATPRHLFTSVPANVFVQGGYLQIKYNGL